MKTRFQLPVSVGLLVFVFVGAAAWAGDSVAMPNGWVRTSAFSRHLKDANNSRIDWHATKESGALQISCEKDSGTPLKLPPHLVLRPDDGMHGRSVVYKLDSGWLVGFEGGEFGGGLWLSSDDGRKTKKITSENVHALVRRNDQVLIFTGLAHAWLDEGKVYAFSLKPSVNTALTMIADLGSAPSDALLDPAGNVLITSSSGVLRLTSEDRVERLYTNRDMPILYPNSITQIDNAIIVGLRFYVVRLQPTKNAYRAEWYRCKSVEENGTNCTCAGSH